MYLFLWCLLSGMALGPWYTNQLFVENCTLETEADCSQLPTRCRDNRSVNKQNALGFLHANGKVHSRRRCCCRTQLPIGCRGVTHSQGSRAFKTLPNHSPTPFPEVTTATPWCNTNRSSLSKLVSSLSPPPTSRHTWHLPSGMSSLHLSFPNQLLHGTR